MPLMRVLELRCTRRLLLGTFESRNLMRFLEGSGLWEGAKSRQRKQSHLKKQPVSMLRGQSPQKVANIHVSLASTLEWT